MKKRRRITEIPGGNNCPKCGKQMQRVEHGSDWKPKASQPYYFRYWDKCAPCKHMQHYEVAKVMLTEPDPLHAEYREIMR